MIFEYLYETLRSAFIIAIEAFVLMWCILIIQHILCLMICLSGGEWKPKSVIDYLLIMVRGTDI